MAQQIIPGGKVALAPLVGNEQTKEAHWIGASLSRLLIEHLRAAGLPILAYNQVAGWLAESKHQLPLSKRSVQAVCSALGVGALIHGRYILDEESKMLGLHLLIEAENVSPAPVEVSTPWAGFPRFVERISLALVERLNVLIDDEMRQRVSRVSRPSSFEALRQTARARIAWAEGEGELALTAVASALALSPDMEEAAAIEVAIARMTGDSSTAREAFRRWAGIATKQRKPLVAAERLILLGHWLIERGDWPEARRAYEDARDLFRREGNERGEARALNNLANLDILRGQVQSAVQTYRRSLRVFEADPQAQQETAVTYLNLALAHKNLGQQEEASRAVEQALTWARRLKDSRLEARCLAQRGAIYDDLGQWGRAGADYEQAARLLDIVGDEIVLAMVKSHQGILSRRQGDYERAESLMIEALETAEAEDLPHEQAVLCLDLAGLYLAMGFHDQAWDYAERAHEVFSRLKSVRLNQVEELLEILESLPEETVGEETMTTQADSSQPGQQPPAPARLDKAGISRPDELPYSPPVIPPTEDAPINEDDASPYGPDTVR